MDEDWRPISTRHNLLDCYEFKTEEKRAIYL